MNSDELEGTWKQLKGKIKQRWGQLTDDQLDIVSGNWDRLTGLIQTHYGDATGRGRAPGEGVSAAV